MLNLYTYFRTFAPALGRKLKRADGQTIVEYALLIALIALAILVLSPTLTSSIKTVFSNTSSALGGSGS